eukprot:1161511-Pelagomonas_calceolata.AAC.1
MQVIVHTGTSTALGMGTGLAGVKKSASFVYCREAPSFSTNTRYRCVCVCVCVNCVTFKYFKYVHVYLPAFCSHGQFADWKFSPAPHSPWQARGRAINAPLLPASCAHG